MSRTYQATREFLEDRGSDRPRVPPPLMVWCGTCGTVHPPMFCPFGCWECGEPFPEDDGRCQECD